MEYLQQPTLSNFNRIKLIRLFPCFSSFQDDIAYKFANLFQEITYAPAETIVNEEELVDSIFLIVSGKAEVTHATMRRKKIQRIPLAILQHGDSIGLSDSGFFSSTGKRTATVTALTEMMLLRLDIKTLATFLAEHQLESAMYDASLQMLRIHFIKQSLPFAKLSHERLIWLADRVVETILPKGEIIFKQGDPGEQCYLIRSGEVEISHKNNDEIKQLAILRAPSLFGEATLITHSLRNATAKALTEVELLVLDHAYLSELIESENNVTNMFMTLMVDRSRPIKNPHVSVHERNSEDGQMLTILKNPDNGTYFKLSSEGAFIWDKLDGKNTLQEITLDLAHQYNFFAPNIVTALISKLSKSAFVTEVDTLQEWQQDNKSFFAKIFYFLQRFLNFRLALGDADPWITRIYQNYIRYLFTAWGKIFLACIAIVGGIFFIAYTNQVIAFFAKNHANLLLLFMLIPFSFLEILLHELGHAFAVKAAGREVHYIGIGWSGVAPVAFTDTSDMWLASRKPRMIVNFAGVYVDILVAGLAAICLTFISNGYIQSLLWLFALYTYIGGLRMLSPLQEMDGYYILMDWIDKNHLRQSAVMWLVKQFPQALKNPPLFKKNWPEVLYWIACIIYLIIISIITLILQEFILRVLRIELSNRYISLLLPFLVMIFSSLSVIAEIRDQQEE